MKPAGTFHVIDSHTAGEPTRMLGDGAPKLVGATMRQRQSYFRAHFDHIRTTLMQEPRGNPGVLAVVVPPSDPEADYGLIFADRRGYVDMCIHGTIGVATSLIECGLVDSRQAESGITFETPAGNVRAAPRFSGGKLQSVTVANVPSYFVGETTFSHPDLGQVKSLLGYGGNLFAYVNSEDVGAKIIPASLGLLLSTARSFFEELDGRKVPSGPTSVARIAGISFYEDLEEDHARNVMIARRDLYDRSPCGTGTSGRMAILAHQGRLHLSETFVNESITGSRFTGRVAEQFERRGRKFIVPEITGSAFITSFSDIVVDERDEFAHGFQVG